jgi:2-keto-4-pentenoate hydratase
VTASDLLASARTKLQRLAELPAALCPQTPDEAYAVQAELIPKLLAHFGGSAIGYKIACTNEIAQRQLHVDGPFFGRLLSATTLTSPARIASGEYFMRVMEAEFAFQMSRDLPSIGMPWTREQVEDSVAGVMAGIEVVDSRFDSWTTVGTPSLIADNACHAAWIHGPLVTAWRDLDLAAQKVRLLINGELTGEGSGAAGRAPGRGRQTQASPRRPRPSLPPWRQAGRGSTPCPPRRSGRCRRDRPSWPL